VPPQLEQDACSLFSGTKIQFDTLSF